jgi:hypothetical protein
MAKKVVWSLRAQNDRKKSSVTGIREINRKIEVLTIFSSHQNPAKLKF